MTVTIESDLKEILGKIDKRLERMEGQLNKLEVGQAELKGDIKTLDERLSGQIKTLDERLSGQIIALDERLSGQIKAVDERLSGQIIAIDKRLESQEFVSRGVLVGLIVAIWGELLNYWVLLANLKLNPRGRISEKCQELIIKKH